MHPHASDIYSLTHSPVSDQAHKTREIWWDWKRSRPRVVACGVVWCAALLGSISGFCLHTRVLTVLLCQAQGHSVHQSWVIKPKRLVGNWRSMGVCAFSPVPACLMYFYSLVEGTETLLMKMWSLKAAENDRRVVATVEARVQANSMLTRQQAGETIDFVWAGSPVSALGCGNRSETPLTLTPSQRFSSFQHPAGLLGH